MRLAEITADGARRIPPKPKLTVTDVCWIGLIYGTQLSIHFMRQNPVPGGYIVATSSSVSVHPIESMPEYCGAKAAVGRQPRISLDVGPLTETQINNFVKASAAILKSVSRPASPNCRRTRGTDHAQKDNITINAVLPGIVQTRNIPEPMRKSFAGQ